MDYKEFFTKRDKELKIDLDVDLHNEMLKQLLVYAIQDKEEDFLNILNNKKYNLYYLSVEFSFSNMYELEGRGEHHQLENIYNSSSFLNMAITSIDEKYIIQIIDKITEKDIENARKNFPQQLTTELIRDCIIYEKYEVLNKLKEKNLINDIAILETIYVYKKTELEKNITDKVRLDAQNIHKVINTIQVSSYKKENNFFLGESKEYVKVVSMRKPNESKSFLFNLAFTEKIRDSLFKSIEECDLMGYEKRNELYQDTLKLIRKELDIHDPQKMITNFGDDRAYIGIKRLLTIFLINGQLDFDSIIKRSDIRTIKKDINLKDLCQYTPKEEEEICVQKFEKMKQFLEMSNIKNEASNKKMKI